MADVHTTAERGAVFPFSDCSLTGEEMTAALQAAQSMPVPWWRAEQHTDTDDIGGISHRWLHMTQERGAAIGDLVVSRSGDQFEAEVCPTGDALSSDAVTLGLFPSVEAAVQALAQHVRLALAWDVACPVAH